MYKVRLWKFVVSDDVPPGGDRVAHIWADIELPFVPYPGLDLAWNVGKDPGEQCETVENVAWHIDEQRFDVSASSCHYSEEDDPRMVSQVAKEDYLPFGWKLREG